MQRAQVPLRYDGTHADQLGQVMPWKRRAWLLNAARHAFGHRDFRFAGSRNHSGQTLHVRNAHYRRHAAIQHSADFYLLLHRRRAGIGLCNSCSCLLTWCNESLCPLTHLLQCVADV